VIQLDGGIHVYACSHVLNLFIWLRLVQHWLSLTVSVQVRSAVDEDVCRYHVFLYQGP
jgi:hypothetical protein